MQSDLFERRLVKDRKRHNSISEMPAGRNRGMPVRWRQVPTAASSRRGSKAFENETWRYQASYGVLSVASPAPNYPMSDEQYRKVARECLEWAKQARTELEGRDFSRHGGGQYARGC